MITRPNVKINLGLDVLRKRPDGYHDIDTLFVPYFRICDTLELVPGDAWSETSASIAERYDHSSQIAQAVSDDGRVMVTVARREGVDWDPLSDLTVKAYRLLAADFELGPVKIYLEKNAPVGAGLGGGSADGAFALRMLSGMFSLGLSDDRLAEYASRLGSDCAFFVYNVPMTGEGRGEILRPYALQGFDYGQEGSGFSYRVEVAVPVGVSVSTAEAYRGITPAEPSEPLKRRLARPVAEWKDVLKNDFEATVFRAHPELAPFKASIYDSGAVYASMSGSGSAMFGIYEV